VQFEFPWALGPPDGRYVVRDAPDVAPTHVLVTATLGAPERRRLRARPARALAPEPVPASVTTARATVIDAQPGAVAAAEGWLAEADTATAQAAIATVARAVRAHRIASGDPCVREPQLTQALVARAGYGAGEQVAEGRWSAARELSLAENARRARRAALLRPQERLAALLGGHRQALACEELALRARLDLDQQRPREAALQLRAALEAALAELPRTRSASALAPRLEELAHGRAAVEQLASAALADTLAPDAETALAEALRTLEAALRARVAAET
jgi:hypothetical protein